METQVETKQVCIMTLKDYGDHGKEKQMDLSPLRDIIECGGLEVLVEALRDTHQGYICALMESSDVLHDFVAEEIPHQLFCLKELADAFGKVKEVNQYRG
jgi:hypothetical protein